MNIDHKRNKTYRFNQNQIFQLDKEHFWFYEIAFFLYELLNVYLIWITWYSNIWYLNQTCTSTICVDVNLVDILYIRFFGSLMINTYKLIKNDFRYTNKTVTSVTLLYCKLITVGPNWSIKTENLYRLFRKKYNLCYWIRHNNLQCKIFCRDFFVKLYQPWKGISSHNLSPRMFR